MALVPFLLSTYANAALAGRPVDFGEAEEALKELFWHADSIEWAFFVPGPHGARLRHDPGAWVETMRASGTRRACFSYGPSREQAGYGILTEGDEGRCYHQAILRRLEDGRYQRLLKGQPVPDDFRLPSETVADTASRLEKVVDPMIALADRHPRSASEFARSLRKARSYLSLIGTGASCDTVDPRVDRLYPAGVYPVDHRLLMSAAQSSSILGGMGSWNDLGVASDELSEYDRITREFANVHVWTYSAASRLDLSPG